MRFLSFLLLHRVNQSISNQPFRFQFYRFQLSNPHYIIYFFPRFFILIFSVRSSIKVLCLISRHTAYNTCYTALKRPHSTIRYFYFHLSFFLILYLTRIYVKYKNNSKNPPQKYFSILFSIKPLIA